MCQILLPVADLELALFNPAAEGIMHEVYLFACDNRPEVNPDQS